MTMLITGANGQVGLELRARAGRSAACWERSELDITQRDDVLAAIADLNPSLVINAAAYTAVDKAETAAADAFAVNRDGAANLAEACKRQGIPLLHISTDYVFDGRKSGAYLETDVASPQGVYARSKWEGEQRIREILPHHLILRVSWVFGHHGNNFVKTVLRLAREKPELRIVADQRGCPTSADSIAATLLAMARHYLESRELPWGTYHYTGSPATTWHGFAIAICENARALGLLGKVPPIQAITTADSPTLAQRPANSLLDCSALERELGLRRQDWRDGLRDVLKSLKMAQAAPKK